MPCASAAADAAPPSLNKLRRRKCSFVVVTILNRVVMRVLLFLHTCANTARRCGLNCNSAIRPRKPEHGRKIFGPMYTEREPAMGRDPDSRPPEEITELLQAWSR